MIRLAMTLYSIIGATMAGTFMIVALVSGADTARPIILAAILGFVVAAPVAVLVARALMRG